jgi:hypothetical protein
MAPGDCHLLLLLLSKGTADKVGSVAETLSAGILLGRRAVVVFDRHCRPTVRRAEKQLDHRSVVVHRRLAIAAWDAFLSPN